MGIQIVAIGGSVREDNFTWKALSLVADEFKKLEVTCEVIDPRDLELAFPGKGESTSAEALKKKVTEATGLILATPEYHGSFSAAMKLVIENLGFPSVLAGKPIALLGVAAGAIGAIKSLEHLRSVCSHIGAVVLPGPVSVANVQKVFDEKGACKDPAVEKRIRGCANTLLDYIHKHICPRVCLEEMVRSDT